jgi:hypothetical protein
MLSAFAIILHNLQCIMIFRSCQHEEGKDMLLNRSYKLTYFSFISTVLCIILTAEDHLNLSKISEDLEIVV